MKMFNVYRVVLNKSMGFYERPVQLNATPMTKKQAEIFRSKMMTYTWCKDVLEEAL